jgi:hypothetical protein
METYLKASKNFRFNVNAAYADLDGFNELIDSCNNPLTMIRDDDSS